MQSKSRVLLIKLRENNNWTQQELAQKLNVSQQTVSLIESGKRNPTLTNAKKIELIFKKPMEELFPDIFLNIDTTKRNKGNVETA